MTQDNAARQTTLDTIYAPQEQWINNQITELPRYYDAQKASMEQAKVNAFRDISNTAQGRGMFFSGFQPHEQARYLGEKYLPGLMEIDNQMNRERTGLLGQLAGIKVGKGEKMLSYSDMWDDRNWGVHQANIDFARQKEMVDYTNQSNLKYAPRSSSRGGWSSGGSSSADKDWGGVLTKATQDWMKMKGSTPARQEQDAFVEDWLNRNGVPIEGRQQYWNTVNTHFGRTANPWDDWTYRR
jgi:hypothetical protein